MIAKRRNTKVRSEQKSRRSGRRLMTTMRKLILHFMHHLLNTSFLPSFLTAIPIPVLVPCETVVTRARARRSITTTDPVDLFLSLRILRGVSFNMRAGYFRFGREGRRNALSAYWSCTRETSAHCCSTLDVLLCGRSGYRRLRRCRVFRRVSWFVLWRWCRTDIDIPGSAICWLSNAGDANQSWESIAVFQD